MKLYTLEENHSETVLDQDEYNLLLLWRQFQRGDCNLEHAQAQVNSWLSLADQ